MEGQRCRHAVAAVYSTYGELPEVTADHEIRSYFINKNQGSCESVVRAAERLRFV